MTQPPVSQITCTLPCKYVLLAQLPNTMCASALPFALPHSPPQAFPDTTKEATEPTSALERLKAKAKKHSPNKAISGNIAHLRKHSVAATVNPNADRELWEALKVDTGTLRVLYRYLLPYTL